MDKETLATIKNNLEQEKAQLEKDLAGFTEKDARISDNYKSKFPNFGNDDDENANEVAEYGDRLSLENALEKQLQDVNKALDNIGKGDYGTCKHCGNPIEEGRLKIRPASSSCVACKKKLKGED